MKYMGRVERDGRLARGAAKNARIGEMFISIKAYEALYKAARSYNDGKTAQRPDEAQVRSAVDDLEVLAYELSQIAQEARERLARAGGCSTWNEAEKALLDDKCGKRHVQLGPEAIAASEELKEANSTAMVAILYINQLKRSIGQLPGFS